MFVAQLMIILPEKNDLLNMNNQMNQNRDLLCMV